MVVPAMEAQGTTGGSSSSLIERRVEATTLCFSFADRPQTTTTTTTTTASEAAGLVVRLTCHVTKYISAGHGKRPLERAYRRGAGGAVASGVVPPGGGEDGVRDALRDMLRSIRPLQDLGLTDGEWESIVPEDVVPQLARARHAAAEVDLVVVRRVRYDAAKVLMTGCKEIDDDCGAVGGDGGGGEAECSVCFDALLREEAVELPGCAHAFHRRCISKWFSRKPTCPMCRGDVAEHLDPELQKHFAEFRDAM